MTLIIYTNFSNSSFLNQYNPFQACTVNYMILSYPITNPSQFIQYYNLGLTVALIFLGFSILAIFLALTEYTRDIRIALFSYLGYYFVYYEIELIKYFFSPFLILDHFNTIQIVYIYVLLLLIQSITTIFVFIEFIKNAIQNFQEIKREWKKGLEDLVSNAIKILNNK